MRITSVTFLIAFGFVACQRSEYKGYSLSRTGLDYKMMVLGDARQPVLDSDMVELNIQVYSLTDSLLFNGKLAKMHIAKLDTGLQELIGMFMVGDSASAYLNSSKLIDILPNISPQKVRAEIGVNAKSKYTSWLFYEKYPELSKDLETKEQLELLRLLKQFDKDSIEVVKGMFLIRNVIGEGPLIKSKNEVSVNYTVKTVDEKILDSTYDRKQPFVFIIGQQGQVLPGFDVGIRKMRKGGKATFIIPSKLAFGSNGSSTGIAKGYETLIYNVEVIEVISELNSES